MLEDSIRSFVLKNAGRNIKRCWLKRAQGPKAGAVIKQFVLVQNTPKKKIFVAIGLIAGFSLLVLYFIVLSLANSFSHALEQFYQIWYWILLLVVGFGIQAGLYFYIRHSFKLKQMSGPTAAVAASGSVSAGSMVACCLHHLTDILPLIGLAAAATFLTTYQLLFIIIGVLSNLIGIAIMLEIIQRHSLSEGFLKKVLIYDMNKIKKAVVVLSLIISAGVFILVGGFWGKIKENPQLNLQAELLQEQKISEKNQSAPLNNLNLPSKTNIQNGISFEIIPIDFNFNNLVKFEIKIETHSGSLDFDLRKISALEDDIGNKYQAIDWQGSSPGGHHRSGILTFSKLDPLAKTIKLIIKDNPDLLPRVFEWDLPR